MSDNQDKKIRMLHDWMNFKAGKKALEQYKETLGEELFEEYEKVLDQSSEFHIPRESTKEERWQALAAKMPKADKKQKTLFIPRTYLSVAASLALLVAAYFLFFFNQPLEVYSGTEYLTHALPDESEVMLNVESLISYDEKWEERTLALQGEAFFKVKEGKQFTVSTPNGEVQVVGTAFNVFARDEQLIVSCEKGAVQVTTGAQYLNLEKGQQARLIENEQLQLIGLTDTSLIGAWRTGEFYFNKVRLQDVLSEMERQFNVRINYSSKIDRGQLYTGYFSVSEGLAEALDNVCTPLAITYRTEGSTVFLE